MTITRLAATLAFATLAAACADLAKQEPAPVRGHNPEATPKFAVDPYWPKPLPGNWMLGQVAGIAVDNDSTSNFCGAILLLVVPL